jgi:hypothetical protein
MANEPEEKRQKEKPNKAYQPSANKSEGSSVKIKIKPGRAAEGVVVDEDGTALVDPQTADYLVAIGYADLV